MKFSQINEPAEGGYTNKFNSFYLVIGIYDMGIPEPTTPSNISTENGVLKDPANNVVQVFDKITFYDYHVKGSLSDEAYSHTVHSTLSKMWLPPQYNLTAFGYAIGFWFSMEEVAKYYLGGAKD